jgi:hypothetical protein
MEDIKKILKGIYDNLELRKTIVPLFIGNPGISKSIQIREFAKEKGVKLIPFVTSQRNPFEISGLAMPDKEEKKMSFWDFDTLLSMKDGDILFFDEVFNGNPTVLNACLTILEEREMISGKKLPDIMIVAAANPQGMVPLTPQIKERFVWYKFNFPKESWKNYMKNKYKMPATVSNKLCTLIKEEDFKKTENYLSARSIDKAVNMIINHVPTPYKDLLNPILETLVTNKLKEPIKLSEDKNLEVGESISWLEMIRINKNIDISEQEEKHIVGEKIPPEYEILAYDSNDNVIGGFKNIDILGKVYYLSSNEIKKINEGIKISPSVISGGTVFFFQKKK